MHIKYLKKMVGEIPKLNKVDEMTDPMIIAHYSGEYFGFEMSEPLDVEFWIIAGQDIKYNTTDGEIFKDFHCFGISKLLTTEMGEFDLYCDILRYGAMFDKNWKPIPLSQFNWG